MDTIKEKKKRNRYEIPSYKKVYSLYIYSRPKYSKIYKRLQTLALKYDKNIFYRVNPYNVLKLCYIYKEGALQGLGDERHIFRCRTLDNILSEIAKVLILEYNLCTDPKTLLYLYRRTGIVLYIDSEGMQAEFMPVTREGIGLRLKANIELLRQLREGVEVEDAVEKVKAKMNATEPKNRSKKTQITKAP